MCNLSNTVCATLRAPMYCVQYAITSALNDTHNACINCHRNHARTHELHVHVYLHIFFHLGSFVANYVSSYHCCWVNVRRCTNVRVVYTVTIRTCYTVDIPEVHLHVPTAVVTGLYFLHGEIVRPSETTCSLVCLTWIISIKKKRRSVKNYNYQINHMWGTCTCTCTLVQNTLAGIMITNTHKITLAGYICTCSCWFFSLFCYGLGCMYMYIFVHIMHTCMQ